MAAKTMLSTLQGLADTFHRREREAHREAIDDRTCGRDDDKSLGRESANASARQLVLDTIAQLEKGDASNVTLSRESYEIANELTHRIQRAELVSDGDLRRLQGVLEGWVRITVGPLIEEREDAISRQFELEEGRRARVARFLRRVARAVEGS
jgi:hypothetical protein